MVDRLRVSGKSVITEDESTGEVSGDFDSVDAGKILHGDHRTVTTAGDFLDAIDGGVENIRISGRFDLDPHVSSYPVQVPDGTIVIGFSSPTPPMDTSPYWAGDGVDADTANSEVIRLGAGSKWHGPGVRNFNTDGFGIRLNGTKSELIESNIHARSRGILTGTSGGASGNEAKVIRNYLTCSEKKETFDHTGVMIYDSLNDCKIRDNVFQGFWLGVRIAAVETVVEQNHVYNFPFDNMGPALYTNFPAERTRVYNNYLENATDGEVAIRLVPGCDFVHNRVRGYLTSGINPLSGDRTDIEDLRIEHNEIRSDGAGTKTDAGGSGDALWTTDTVGSQVIVENNRIVGGWNEAALTSSTSQL